MTPESGDQMSQLLADSCRSEYILTGLFGGPVLTWTEYSEIEARNANLELESEGSLLQWLRLELIN